MSEHEEQLEQEQEKTPEYTEIEVEAMEHGWNPEGVEGRRNLTAEEFMDRKPLYDELKSMRKTVKRVRDDFETLKEYHSKQEEKVRERVIAELKAQKATALENDDFEAVVEIDDRLAEAKASKVETKTSNVIFEEWVEDNSWYNQDAEMREYADTIGNGYAARNPGKSLDDVYEYVSKTVKKTFPEKFENPKRKQPDMVEGVSKSRGTKTAKYSVKDLPEDDYKIMKTLLRTGVFDSEEEYLKEYFG